MSLTRPIRAAAFLTVLLSGPTLGQGVTPFPAGASELAHRQQFPSVFVDALDPRIGFSDFCNLTVVGSAVDFDRLSVPWFGALHGPGARINFRTDAQQIDLHVSYLDTFTNPGSGLFRLEVDGVLLPALFGSDTDQGDQVYTLVDGLSQRPHEYSLLFPYAADVLFQGLTLSGGSAALLGAPPSRPPFLYAAYGDSITHGYDATSVAESYPSRVGRLRGWSVVNMGFAARAVAAGDGTALGNVGADCVTVAIGVNDFFDPMTTPLSTFETRYDDLLDNLRALQPNVPVFCITPTWIMGEAVPNTLGNLVEQYRQVIRDVVLRRMGVDLNLYLVEGPSLVPSGTANFPDGIHPNDAGMTSYAAGLDAVFTTVFGAPDGGGGSPSSGPSARWFGAPSVAGATASANRHRRGITEPAPPERRLPGSVGAADVLTVRELRDGRGLVGWSLVLENSSRVEVPVWLVILPEAGEPRALRLSVPPGGRRESLIRDVVLDVGGRLSVFAVRDGESGLERSSSYDLRSTGPERTEAR